MTLSGPQSVASGSENEFEITVFDSFDGARMAWESLEAKGNSYAFQSYAWLSVWYDIIGRRSDPQLCIVLVRHYGGAPIMLLPLAIEKRAGLLCLIWLGGVLADYQAPILSRAADFGNRGFEEIWAAIRNALPPHDVVFFEKQPEYINTQQNPFVTLDCQPHASSAHLVQLSGTIDSFLTKTRSKKTLATERRKRKKLERRGTLSFVVANTPDEAKHILTAMIRQKSENYRDLGVVDLFASKPYRDFLERLSTSGMQDGFVHVCAVKLDDRIIATHWGLVYKRRLYYLFPGYERGDLTRFSPGNILLHFLLAWCLENEITVCDFTVGDEPYKFQWRDTELRLFDFMQSYTVSGYRYILPLRVKSKLKRRIKQSPALLKPLYKLRSIKTRLARQLGLSKA